MPDPNPGVLQVSPAELARSSEEMKSLADKAKDIPESVTIWVGPYLARLALDPFGKEFAKKVLGTTQGAEEALKKGAAVLEGTGTGGQTSAGLFATADDLGTESALNLAKGVHGSR
jgi:hypothetical protein